MHFFAEEEGRVVGSDVRYERRRPYPLKGLDDIALERRFGVAQNQDESFLLLHSTDPFGDHVIIKIGFPGAGGAAFDVPAVIGASPVFLLFTR